MPGFEFDPLKSSLNQTKHGIDFLKAQQLWAMPTLEFSSKMPGELRKLVIGQISGRYWTAIITYRSENIRIISVRRARTNEIELYCNSYNER